MGEGVEDGRGGGGWGPSCYAPGMTQWLHG
jgi:hypothetical protein